MASINLIGSLYSDKEEIEDTHIKKAIEIAKRTAVMIEEEEDELPKDEEIDKCIHSVFRDIFGKTAISKGQLVNAVMLYGKYSKRVAEYIVHRSFSQGIIVDVKSGFRTDYTLA